MPSPPARQRLEGGRGSVAANVYGLLSPNDLAFRKNFGEISMRLAAFAIAASFVATSALAQPLPAPASYPPVMGEKGVVTTHEISLDMAEKIARAGIEACRKMGFHTTMVVIDSGGTLKAFLRDDKTGPHTVTLAQDKAFTALTLASRFMCVRAAHARCSIR